MEVCSAPNEGEIVIINIQIYCFSLSQSPRGGGMLSDLFPPPLSVSISNWTFLMINWAAPRRGLTPQSPTRNFHHSQKIIDYFSPPFPEVLGLEFPAESSTSLFRITTLVLLHMYFIVHRAIKSEMFMQWNIFPFHSFLCFICGTWYHAQCILIYAIFIL